MYIIRNKTTKEVIRTSKQPIAIDDDGNARTPAGLDPNVEILKVVDLEKPIYDSSTQKLSRKETESKGVISRGYEVQELSQEELAVKAELQALNEKRVVITQAIPVLRRWAEDANAVTVTTQNAVSVLNILIPRIGTFFDKFADLLEISDTNAI